MRVGFGFFLYHALSLVADLSQLLKFVTCSHIFSPCCGFSLRTLNCQSFYCIIRILIMPEALKLEAQKLRVNSGRVDVNFKEQSPFLKTGESKDAKDSTPKFFFKIRK